MPRKIVTTVGRNLRKRGKNVRLKDITDKSIQREGLSDKQKRDIRNSSIQQYQTEARKGGEGAILRATERAGRVAALQSSAQAAMNELSNKQALRQAAAKEKEDSPTPFKMVAASKEYDSPTVFSNKAQSTMGAFNYGMPADSPASYGTDPDKDKVGPDGMTDYARRRKAKQEEARKKIERLQEQHENRETTSSGGRAKSFTFGPIRGRDTYGG